MIKSMTGFGRAEVITKERKITVELKSGLKIDIEG